MTGPVFVLGTGRCGSTLVHEVLARHSDTGFMTNLDDLNVLPSTAWQNELWRRLPARVTRKGGTRFAPTEGYRALAREVGPVVVEPVRDLVAADATPWLRDRLATFMDSRAARIGAPVFLHKLTGWPRAGLLDACFDDAVFVEVVRDGRAVTSSWLQMDWWRGHRGPAEWHFGPLDPEDEQEWLESGRSFPALAALGWRMLMQAYDEARALVPEDRWLRIRYEDIVADPRAGFAQVLDAVGLPWTRGFESQLARYEFATGRTDAFRRDLGQDALETVEAVLGKQLVELGY
ncbi:sulfotransferase [Nocardioides sp. SR21]|uniref:sulfotransferase family protein n=1 Tax=Nocardioides sp. SR21 TaxID=2919501 RepID=UPI001FA9B7F7|nr:sulfotransferase [Nocardioides sp. SR21]